MRMIRRWATRVLRCTGFVLGLGVVAGVLGIGYATWRHGQVVILPPPSGGHAVVPAYEPGQVPEASAP